MKSIGRKRILLFGFLLASISMIGFCIGHCFLFRYQYLILFLFCRALLGISTAMIQTTSLSIISSQFPHDVIKIMGYLEAAAGFGLTTGPLIGSCLFALWGFNTPFITFCFIFIILGILSVNVIPYDKSSVSPLIQEISDQNLKSP